MDDLLRNLQSTVDVRTTNQLNILDIEYSHLIENPMAVLHRIYDYIGEEFNDYTQSRVMTYLTANPKNKFGRHHYGLEEFGLDGKEIIEKFQFYKVF